MSDRTEYKFNSQIDDDAMRVYGVITVAAFRELRRLNASVFGVPAGQIKLGDHLHEAVKITYVPLDENASEWVLPRFVLDPVFHGSPRDEEGKPRRYMVFIETDPIERSDIMDQFVHSDSDMARAMSACFQYWEQYGQRERRFEFRIVDRDTFLVLCECEADTRDPHYSWNWRSGV